MKLNNDNNYKVLTVGVQYVDHKGGIGSVIETYSNYFKPFNFIATYKPQKYKILILPFFLASCFNLIRFLYLNKQIKIVHIHGASRGSFYRKYIVFLISKNIFSKKIIYHIHGAEYHMFYNRSSRFIKHMIIKMIESSEHIICLSESWQVFFSSNFKTKSISTLPNIVNKNTLKRKTMSNELNLLFLGRIGNRKGIFDLVDIFEKNKEKWKNVKLKIGGDGEIEKLESILKDKKLNNIEYIGWVTGMKKKEVINDSDIFILPSYNEGLPISILEAMSFGKPIISTNVGGIPEIVINKHNGFLITPGLIQELEKSINFFIENPNQISHFGVNSLEIVKSHYPEKVLSQLFELYNDIINE
jgi:glycosyltransferase involved in cell wall biosynthesis